MRGERGQACPREGDFESPRVRNPYTPIIPDSGCRPKYTPRRETENPRGYARREEFEGEGPKGERKECKFSQIPEV